MAEHTAAERLRFMAARRSATLGTIAPSGEPRLVPVCFVLGPSAGPDALPPLWIPLDEKPKRTSDVRELARVRDLRADPRVTLLFDRWSEDWTQLAWVRATGRAALVEADDDPARHARAVAALRAKHPQYREQRLEVAPMIRVELLRLRSWGDLATSPA